MVALIALFPAYIMWAPNAIWKPFDLFVGLIQAFIFSLLTILYFWQAMETGRAPLDFARPPAEATADPGRPYYQKRKGK